MYQSHFTVRARNSIRRLDGLVAHGVAHHGLGGWLPALFLQLLVSLKASASRVIGWCCLDRGWVCHIFHIMGHDMVHMVLNMDGWVCHIVHTMGHNMVHFMVLNMDG